MLLAWLGVSDRACGSGPLDGDFQIRTAFVVVDHGVLQLNARIQYPSNDSIRGALQDGLTLLFDLEVSVISCTARLPKSTTFSGWPRSWHDSR